MKKKAFTLLEVLFASSIFSMILVIGLSVISMMSSSLYDGQTEETNRSEFNDIVFYLTREIQSAEKIKIEDDGKTVKIKQHGTDGYNMRYSLVDDYPTGYMSFNDKKIIDIDYDESKFYLDSDCVNVEISVVKNSIVPGQRGKKMSLKIMPRSNAILEE
jgi:prepilin-type N-terminal cleavage/methylation domain-containing protein